MEPIGSDLSCNICCDLLKTEKLTTHMKIHEKYLNLDASVDCPSCKENVCKRQLNAHFAQVRYNYIGILYLYDFKFKAYILLTKLYNLLIAPSK